MTDVERIAHIRELAKAVGYAVGEHGSKARDIDLIAVPWADDAIGRADFIEMLRDTLPCHLSNLTPKPHGRLGVILEGYGHKPIDLSVMPRSASSASEGQK